MTAGPLRQNEWLRSALCTAILDQTTLKDSNFAYRAFLSTRSRGDATRTSNVLSFLQMSMLHFVSGGLDTFKTTFFTKVSEFRPLKLNHDKFAHHFMHSWMKYRRFCMPSSKDYSVASAFLGISCVISTIMRRDNSKIISLTRGQWPNQLLYII